MEQYQFICKHFTELKIEELYEILKIRQKVFVVEQNCPYLDLDDLDVLGFHLTLMDHDKIIAYCRILPKDKPFQGFVSIGRVLSSPDYRKSGTGKAIMEKAIMSIQHLWPKESIKICAQSYLQGFYESFGFIDIEEYFILDGIPHQKMVLMIQ